ncbi:4-amino-4-deoxychorismate lyase [Paenibacillus anaericanus]|uniref:aminodeoxychorismate lyase n=1 Tax=Paenibacillus anaericanus TaxID=170367 RepID=UPI002785CE73|nr:aminodeoxychorismate lyase [Paenibacillus anaericanus]MDQ0091776.1 4-amino-4-deoxychorismate lyase [Paenibacillus anaericanus]
MKYIGVNGKPTPTAEAVISVMDHGFMYGVGLFETFRTYGGRPFLLERHLERLRQGCHSLGIRYIGDPDQVATEIQDLMQANGLQEGYIRFTVSAGEGPLGLPSDDYVKPTVIVYVKPLPDPGTRLYTEGKELWRLSTRRNTPEGDIRFKSLHYMNNILAKRELSQYKPNPALPIEGLLLTEQEYLAEGIVSNLFFVLGGTLYTPNIGTGILPGITRAVVLEMAEEHGLDKQEGQYTWEMLMEADEIFVTNSIQELVPVTKLVVPRLESTEGSAGSFHRISGGEIGPITARLLSSYRAKVGI